jgi:hypothetical protein
MSRLKMGHKVPDSPTYDTLTVTLLPAEAVSAGAQWRLDNGAWQNSEAVVTNISPGSHTISYKPIDLWLEPSSESLIILSNDYIYLTRYYYFSPTADRICCIHSDPGGTGGLGIAPAVPTSKYPIGCTIRVSGAGTNCNGDYTVTFVYSFQFHTIIDVSSMNPLCYNCTPACPDGNHGLCKRLT